MSVSLWWKTCIQNYLSRRLWRMYWSFLSPNHIVSFDPVVRCGRARLRKCWLLMRLLACSSLDYRKWQASCWRYLEVTNKWITRYFPLKWYKSFCSGVRQVMETLFHKSCWVEKLGISWWLNKLITILLLIWLVLSESWKSGHSAPTYIFCRISSNGGKILKVIKMNQRVS
jgi:hypothetical protein